MYPVGISAVLKTGLVVVVEGLRDHPLHGHSEVVQEVVDVLPADCRS